ncbi:hypothetical protein [Priestia megaterium]|uniref:hypothetical protein n=1 Tax=Priestia megaterium TaxID=1404 RepID=UPI0023DC66E2|nr:hypothetical protein [Priestia megaterium]MDF2010203.1 hypothetical protein [Priestia megaterium]
MEQENVQETVQETVSTNVDTNTSTEVETKVETEQGVQTETTPEVKTEAKPIMIPKERFDEVNGKYKELSGQLSEMQKAKEAMEQQLAEMQKANETTSSSIQQTTEKLEGQVKQYETLIGEMVTTKLQAIPEDMHDLIPEGLSTEQKLAWINKAEGKGLFKKQKTVEIGTPLNHSSEQDTTERMKKMNPLQLFASYYGGK